MIYDICNDAEQLLNQYSIPVLNPETSKAIKEKQKQIFSELENQIKWLMHQNDHTKQQIHQKAESLKQKWEKLHEEISQLQQQKSHINILPEIEQKLNKNFELYTMELAEITKYGIDLVSRIMDETLNKSNNSVKCSENISDSVMELVHATCTDREGYFNMRNHMIFLKYKINLNGLQNCKETLAAVADLDKSHPVFLNEIKNVRKLFDQAQSVFDKTHATA